MQRHRRLVPEVARLLRNVAFDLKYGAFLGGTVAARSPGAHASGNTDYAVMDQFFRGRIHEHDVLVDVGCGRGRVLNWWLRYHGTHRIVGIELLEEVAAATAARLRSYSNVQVIAGDALENLPSDGTLFFLFNPFDAPTMARFKERFRALCRANPARRLLYYAPVHLDIFAQDPEWRVVVQPVQAPAAGKFEERHARLAEITWRGHHV